MSHSLFFLSDSTVRADFDCELEAGDAVTIAGRFSPSAPDGWEDRTYQSADEAADVIEEAVRAHFGSGIEDRTRLTRIMLHKPPTAIPEPLLWRYGVPLLVADTGKRQAP